MPIQFIWKAFVQLYFPLWRVFSDGMHEPRCASVMAGFEHTILESRVNTATIVSYLYWLKFFRLFTALSCLSYLKSSIIKPRSQNFIAIRCSCITLFQHSLAY